MNKTWETVFHLPKLIFYFDEVLYDDGGELFDSKTNDEHIIEELDRVTLTMKREERAMLTFPPEYAYGYCLLLTINFLAPMGRYATDPILLLEFEKADIDEYVKDILYKYSFNTSFSLKV